MKPAYTYSSVEPPSTLLCQSGLLRSLGFVHDLRSQFSDGPPLADYQAALIILPLMWAHVWVLDFKMLASFAFLSIAVAFYMVLNIDLKRHHYGCWYTMPDKSIFLSDVIALYIQAAIIV